MKIHDVQQKSEAWFQLRLGIPTSSEFSRIVTSTGEPSKSRSGYARQLAAELYAGASLNSWGGNVSLDRGVHLEDDAINAYCFDRDVEAVKVGFITDDDCSYGCSPDALIGDDSVIEVKCINADRHLEAILRYQKKGDIAPDYVQQVQGQLLVTGRKFVDLILFHPKLPMLVVRYEPIPAVQTGLLHGIAAVLKERDEVLSMLVAQRDGNVANSPCRTDGSE